jgi:hypothetical protein
MGIIFHAHSSYQSNALEVRLGKRMRRVRTHSDNRRNHPLRTGTRLRRRIRNWRSPKYRSSLFPFAPTKCISMPTKKPKYRVLRKIKSQSIVRGHAMPPPLFNNDNSQTSHPINDQATHSETLSAIPTARLGVIMFPNAIFSDHINPYSHDFIYFVAADVSLVPREWQYYFPCL